MNDMQVLFKKIKGDAQDALVIVKRLRNKPQNKRSDVDQYDEQLCWINCVIDDCDKVLCAGDRLGINED